jgi:predicted aldo/keto reductase-like oxidoreductase
MKPYGGGRLLSMEYTPFEKPLTPVKCIHYALSRPGVVSVLPGVANKGQLEEALKYVNASEEERDYSLIAKSPKYALTGKCMYCNHCRPCLMNIDIGMVTKLYDLATAQPVVPETVREHYKALEVHADACIECGQCEPNCPFGVPIIENMRKTRALFTV